MQMAYNITKTVYFKWNGLYLITVKFIALSKERK